MPRRRKNGADETPPTDGGTDAPQEQSNSKARADTIRAAARWLSDKEGEVKALRAEIASYKKTHVQGDLGFKLADWNWLYRPYNLEGDDRDQLLDTIREGFAALGVGQQSSFLDAMEQTPATAPNGGTAPLHEIARATGLADGIAGVQDHADRWPPGEYGAADYAMGHAEGQRQRMERMTDISGA